MSDNFLIIDNIISKTYLRYLVDKIFDINWKFSSNMTYADGNYFPDNNEPGLSGILTEEQKMFILPLVFKICDMSNISIQNINQISGITPRLHTFWTQESRITDIHIDTDIEHYVIIFYPHTSDGKTILYNETTSELNGKIFSKMNINQRREATKNFSILKKVDSVENRALIFKGNNYHSTYTSSKGPRCIININIDIIKNSKNEKTFSYS